MNLYVKKHKLFKINEKTKKKGKEILISFHAKIKKLVFPVTWNEGFSEMFFTFLHFHAIRLKFYIG